MFSRGGSNRHAMYVVWCAALQKLFYIAKWALGKHSSSAAACSLPTYFNPQKNGIKCSNLNHESSLVFD